MPSRTALRTGFLFRIVAPIGEISFETLLLLEGFLVLWGGLAVVHYCPYNEENRFWSAPLFVDDDMGAWKTQRNHPRAAPAFFPLFPFEFFTLSVFFPFGYGITLSRSGIHKKEISRNIGPNSTFAKKNMGTSGNYGFFCFCFWRFHPKPDWVLDTRIGERSSSPPYVYARGFSPGILKKKNVFKGQSGKIFPLFLDGGKKGPPHPF